MARLFASQWAPEYGSPEQFAADQETGVAAQLWEHPSLTAVDCPDRPCRLAFVDGIRKVEAELFYAADDRAQPTPGVAGVLAVGGVVPGPDGMLRVEPVFVERLAILVGENAPLLPEQPGGWSWTAATCQEDPVAELHERMRLREAELSARLASEGHTVCLDGPLSVLPPEGLAIVGYIKTHHRRLLDPEDHHRVGTLGFRQRSTIFSLGEKLSCYFRLAAPRPEFHPWHGIVRLEARSAPGAAELLGTVCSALPRFAGVAHIDPRAPQNLQAVGALEKELRRRCGDTRLGTRAARAAVRERSSWTNIG